MNNAIIKICNGEYINDDAIKNTIKYIYRLEKKRNLSPCGYSIFPPTYEDIIREFEYVRTAQNHVPDRKVWHLVLSFPENEANQQYFYYRLADEIAKLFSNAYMVCYAFHNDTNNFHTHFIISATSYLPNHPELSGNAVMQYLYQAQVIADNCNITLDIKEGSNV